MVHARHRPPVTDNRQANRKKVSLLQILFFMSTDRSCVARSFFSNEEDKKQAWHNLEHKIIFYPTYNLRLKARDGNASARISQNTKNSSVPKCISVVSKLDIFLLLHSTFKAKMNTNNCLIY